MNGIRASAAATPAPPVPLARLQAARLVLLTTEGLLQLLTLVATARARPPLYGALLALLLWVTLLGEPARVLASWIIETRRSASRTGDPPRGS